MISITVKEYARLTTAAIDPTRDEAQITTSAFRHICQCDEKLRKSGSALVKYESGQVLCLQNYVGVLETPCGTRIEILPKHMDGSDDVYKARQLLARMLERSLDLPTREVGEADLHTFKVPLQEWVMGRFLAALDHVVKKGVRFAYHRIEEEQRFLRGRLDLLRRMRRPPGQQHIFDIQHDVFDPDRAENRLLRSALDRVCSLTQDPNNWRISRELSAYLSPILPSQNVIEDFRSWQRDRLMAHYDGIKPWCELILREQLPMTVAGQWHGFSLLYPMEKLFERYVADCLKRALRNSAKVITQASREHLCRHKSAGWFELRPDMLVVRGQLTCVLDTKWKVLDAFSNTPGEKYGIAQEDMYQMFAYGQRYLNGRGTMFLIYPKNKRFTRVIPQFEFSDELRLWAIPFDLERGAVAPDGMPEELKAVLGLAPWANEAVA